MGINPTAVKTGATVPAVYQQRYPQAPLRPFALTQPVAPEDVVDYVELHDPGQPPTGRQKSPYSVLRDPEKSAGALIDVWI
jgi:hypothetical protein